MAPTAAPQRGEAWAREENEAAVDDYLDMLALEYGGQAYSKAVHRRALARKLNGRSKGAIDRKHQNISAVLLELGYHPIPGYKRLPNYQRLLLEIVAERLRLTPALDAAAATAVEQSAVVPAVPNFSRFVVEAPRRIEAPPTRRADAQDEVRLLDMRAVKRDYVEREARNRSLGMAGELLVVDLERWRLERAGQPELARKVVHVSTELGDGPGFDVLSYRADGAERYIEVKTTAFGLDTPFFVTQREREASERSPGKYSLYRLFAFRRSPRLYELNGRIEDHCWLRARTYLATFS